MSQYRAFVEHAEAQSAFLGSDLNTGGSSTSTLYPHATNVIANEIAAGSALVKPTDFDLQPAHHQPAAFIATPVLKVTDTEVTAPGSRTHGPVEPHRNLTVFIYGGYWKARPFVCRRSELTRCTGAHQSGNAECLVR